MFNIFFSHDYYFEVIDQVVLVTVKVQFHTTIRCKNGHHVILDNCCALQSDS